MLIADRQICFVVNILSSDFQKTEKQYMSTLRVISLLRYLLDGETSENQEKVPRHSRYTSPPGHATD